jgi:hypothetical protein
MTFKIDIFQCDINKNANDTIEKHLLEHYKKQNILKVDGK